MNEKKYTSLKLSKILMERGFKMKSEYLQDNIGNIYMNTMPRIRISDKTKHDGNTVGDFYPAYDLLWDICIKYAKELFGEKSYKCEECGCTEVIEYGEYDLHGYSYCKDCNKTGRNKYQELEMVNHGWEWISDKIFKLLRQNKKQETEDYIISHLNL